MAEDEDEFGEKESPWIELKVITSARMSAIWSYAKAQGYTNMKEFWAAMHEQEWNFYDVLKAESPD